MKLNFKNWLSKESIFGQPADEPLIPPTEFHKDSDGNVGGMPSYEIPPALPINQKIKKQNKKMKKNN